MLAKMPGESRIESVFDLRLMAAKQMKQSVAKSPFESSYEFMIKAVSTLDEAKGEIRPFPDKAYIRYLSEIRQGTQIFALEKSRRMLVTWWMLMEYLYDTMTVKNHANFIGSRKLETSAYLLGNQRILGVYSRIPDDIWPNKPTLTAHGKFENGYTRLECQETGSYIQAIASGADQLRQYTASNVFCDEFAFWDKAESSYGAFKPTIEGGGHIDLVSTANLGAYMHDLIYD